MFSKLSVSVSVSSWYQGACPLRSVLLPPRRLKCGLVRLQSEGECECFSFLFPSPPQRFAVLSFTRHFLSCRVHVKNSRLAGLPDNLKWNYSVCACATERASVSACTCASKRPGKCLSQAEMLMSDSMHPGSADERVDSSWTFYPGPTVSYTHLNDANFPTANRLCSAFKGVFAGLTEVACKLGSCLCLRKHRKQLRPRLKE